MQIIEPLALGVADVLSNDAPAAAAWDSGTAYTVGQIAIDGGKVYRARRANTNIDPSDNPETWEFTASDTSNQNAFIDGTVTTATVDPGGSLNISLQPGQGFNALALFNIFADSVSVEVLDDVAGNQIFDQTYSLDISDVGDWFDYFYNPIQTASELLISDIPRYTNAVVNISLDSPSGWAQLGIVVAGSIATIGDQDARMRYGIRDYSEVETDADGATTLTVGSFARRLDSRARVVTEDIPYVSTVLTGIRGTPAVFVPSVAARFSVMMTYGYLRDWSIDVMDPQNAELTYQIEGLI